MFEGVHACSGTSAAAAPTHRGCLTSIFIFCFGVRSPWRMMAMTQRSSILERRSRLNITKTRAASTPVLDAAAAGQQSSPEHTWIQRWSERWGCLLPPWGWTRGCGTGAPTPSSPCS